jgi:hypothetical protein
MIEIDENESNPSLMNPIALIEATAASRSAVQGALATDPVAPSPTAATAASHRKRRSLSTLLAAVRHLGRDERCLPVAQPQARRGG